MFDLSKPLPLQGPPGHRTVTADYFFNKDLEYLKTSNPEVTYTTSITKTKAARYEIKGIEDMVNKFSKQNVYSTKAILGVSVKKLHGYGHLEEIMVKRSDQQLYTFKEEMPKRKWTVVDRRISGLMVELIDKQLREREIIRNLERLVGARELEMDYKLMTHTF
ncbi:hypothetical protein Tco_0686466 [Tanacetum coccineum]